MNLLAKQSVANFRVCPSNFPLLSLIFVDSCVVLCCFTLIERPFDPKVKSEKCYETCSHQRYFYNDF